MILRNKIGPMIPMIALSLAATLGGCAANEGSADEPEVVSAMGAAGAVGEETGEGAQAFATFNAFDHALLGHFFFDRAPYFGPFGFLGGACSGAGLGGCW